MNDVGVAKRDSVIEMGLLEHAIREDLNRTADRVMAVLHPVKVIIENYPEGQTEEVEAVNNPEDSSRRDSTNFLSRVKSILSVMTFERIHPRSIFDYRQGRKFVFGMGISSNVSGLIKIKTQGKLRRFDVHMIQRQNVAVRKPAERSKERFIGFPCNMLC